MSLPPRSHRLFWTVLSSLLLNSIGAQRVAAQDCNLNGVADENDISAGTSEDCNDNLVPDECEQVQLDLGVEAIPRLPDHEPRFLIDGDFDGDGVSELLSFNFVVGERGGSVSRIVNGGPGGPQLESTILTGPREAYRESGSPCPESHAP